MPYCKSEKTAFVENNDLFQFIIHSKRFVDNYIIHLDKIININNLESIKYKLTSTCKSRTNKHLSIRAIVGRETGWQCYMCKKQAGL